MPISTSHLPSPSSVTLVKASACLAIAGWLLSGGNDYATDNTVSARQLNISGSYFIVS